MNKTALFLSLTFALFALPKIVFGQNLDFASTYTVNDPNAVSGDIMSSIPGRGLVRSEDVYDFRIFGVLQDNPVIVYKEASSSAKAIVRNGDAVVRVTDFNGEIRPGSYITSSPIKGYGMRAADSGYVVGVATSAITPLEKVNYEGKEYNSGLVNVAIRIEFAELGAPRSIQRTLSYFNSSLFKNIQDPEKFGNFLRYIIVGLIAIVSFGIGFYTFARSIPKAIEAVGRNPLARRSIEFSILMNLVLTVVSIGVGLILSLAVLRL